MPPRRVVMIGQRAVGSREPVYIVAEAGVNHDGDLGRARELIHAAAAAGADAVKFQLFRAEALVSAAAPTCEYQQRATRGESSQRRLLERLELPPASFADLKTEAEQCGLDFLATPFGVRELDLLVRLPVRAVKIASPDIVNVPLLDRAARCGLPLILSTGASTLTEIQDAVRLVRSRQQASRLILLHCVSAYPTDPAAARLRCIRTLGRRFRTPVGFSDHTPEPDFSALAVAAGACVLEKHLTLDRRSPGPDHFFSLEPRQFAEYVAAARHAFSCLGSGDVEVSPDEFAVRRLARGSVVTAAPVRAGQTLTPAVLTVRRPADGIDPARWEEILGRTAKTDIPVDTPLSWSMLE